MSDKDKENSDSDDGDAHMGAQVGTMKNGEYLLHVLVESGKNISLEGEDNVDPLIQVSFMGKKKETTAKKDVTSSQTVTWDEHLYIEPGEVKGHDIESQLIKIEIFNKGFFK